MANLRVLAQIVFELLVFYVEQEILMISENWQKLQNPPNLKWSQLRNSSSYNPMA